MDCNAVKTSVMAIYDLMLIGFHECFFLDVCWCSFRIFFRFLSGFGAEVLDFA